MDPYDDVSHVLADLLGTTADAMADEIGGGWRHAPAPDSDEQPGSDDQRRSWFVSGEPLQVMVGVGHRDVCVAEPEIQWRGHIPVLVPATILGTHALATIGAGGPLRDAVHEAQERRRATFRYCRYCRRLTAPEHQFGDDICQGCSAQFLSVTY